MARPVVTGQGVVSLNYGRVEFRSDIRKNFFTLRVVKHWNTLSREVAGAPSLETLKAWLDRALSNLMYSKTSLLTAGRLG